MPHRAILCKQNQNCQKITQPLTFVLFNISETRSWIQNHRTVLHKQILKSLITFYTANFYHSTNLVWYKWLGVSHFVEFFTMETFQTLKMSESNMCPENTPCI